MSFCICRILLAVTSCNFIFERGVCMSFIISFVVFQCYPAVDATFVTWCLLSQLFSTSRVGSDCEITLLFRDVC